jgi:hypothetical protein
MIAYFLFGWSVRKGVRKAKGKLVGIRYHSKSYTVVHQNSCLNYVV